MNAWGLPYALAPFKYQVKCCSSFATSFQHSTQTAELRCGRCWSAPGAGSIWLVVAKSTRRSYLRWRLPAPSRSIPDS